MTSSFTSDANTIGVDRKIVEKYIFKNILLTNTSAEVNLAISFKRWSESPREYHTGKGHRAELK